jgi:uncharacterized protein YcfJ
MKTLAIAVASLFTAIGPAVHAAYDPYGNYYESSDYRSPDSRETARVIQSRPVYASVAPREECWNKRFGRFEPRPEANPRVGAETAIGAIAVDTTRCRTIASSGSTLQGYDVRYVYRGKQYTARMGSDPGRRLVLGRDIRDDGTPYEYTTDVLHNAYNDPSYDPTLR